MKTQNSTSYNIVENNIIVSNRFKSYELAKGTNEAIYKITQILNYWNLDTSLYIFDDSVKDKYPYDYLVNLIELIQKESYPILIKHIIHVSYIDYSGEEHVTKNFYGFSVKQVLVKIFIENRISLNALLMRDEDSHRYTPTYIYERLNNFSKKDGFYFGDIKVNELYIIRDISNYFKDLELADYNWDDWISPDDKVYISNEINPYDPKIEMEFDEE